MTKLQELIEERLESYMTLPFYDTVNTPRMESFLRETIDRTIELMEGCVPEEKAYHPKFDKCYWCEEMRYACNHLDGYDICREQTLSNIKALKV